MIKTPELKDMDFKELVDEQAGRSLMMLGSGTSMHSMIHEAMRIALVWVSERNTSKEQALRESISEALIIARGDGNPANSLSIIETMLTNALK